MSARVPVHISPYFEELHPRVRLVCVCLTSSVCSSVSRCVSTSLSLFPSLSLSVSLSLCVSGCLFVCIFVCLFVGLCLSVSLSLHVLLCLSVCLPVCVSVCLPARARLSARVAASGSACLLFGHQFRTSRAAARTEGPARFTEISRKCRGGGGEGGQTGEQRGRLERREKNRGGARVSLAGASCKRPQGGYAVVGSGGGFLT